MLTADSIGWAAANVALADSRGRWEQQPARLPGPGQLECGVDTGHNVSWKGHAR